jgi:Immunity protein 43
MHFYLKYKGDDIKGSGLPVWLETKFPMVDETPGLDKKLLTGDPESLRLIEGQDVIFHDRNINFDFFDQHKNIHIVSENFLRILDGLKMDYAYAKLNAFIAGSQQKPVKITHKSYFVCSISTELEAIDLSTSEYRLDRAADGRIIYIDEEKKQPGLKYIYKYLVDNQKANGYDLFRPKELPERLIASADFLMKVRQQNLLGLDLPPTVDVDLMDFPGYRRGQRIVDRFPEG